LGIASFFAQSRLETLKDGGLNVFDAHQGHLNLIENRLDPGAWVNKSIRRIKAVFAEIKGKWSNLITPFFSLVSSKTTPTAASHDGEIPIFSGLTG
jgi:hypothetical protein